MERVIQLIREFFENANWKYQFDEKQSTFSAEIEMDDVLGDLKLLIAVRNSFLRVYAVMGARASTESYGRIAEYLHRANSGLNDGNFELDYSGGEIRYKTFVGFDEQTKLSKTVVIKSIFIPVFMFDRYGRGIVKLILEEDDPARLIQEAESRDK